MLSLSLGQLLFEPTTLLLRLKDARCDTSLNLPLQLVESLSPLSRSYTGRIP